MGSFSTAHLTLCRGALVYCRTVAEKHCSDVPGPDPHPGSRPTFRGPDPHPGSRPTFRGPDPHSESRHKSRNQTHIQGPGLCSVLPGAEFQDCRQSEMLARVTRLLSLWCKLFFACLQVSLHPPLPAPLPSHHPHPSHHKAVDPHLRSVINLIPLWNTATKNPPI